VAGGDGGADGEVEFGAEGHELTMMHGFVAREPARGVIF
jgi:hypothetical protein